MVIERRDLEKIEFIILKDFPKLSKEQIEKRDKIWKTVKKENPKVYNGTHFGAVKVEKSKARSYKVYLNKNQYKNTVYSVKTQDFSPGSHAAAVRVVIFDDKFIYLVQRSGSTTLHKNTISLISGNLDFEANTNNVLEVASRMIKEEIKEEIQLKTKTKTPKTHSILFNNKNYKLVFNFILEGTPIGLTNDENRKILRVERGNIANFIKENDNNIIKGSNIRKFLVSFLK